MLLGKLAHYRKIKMLYTYTIQKIILSELKTSVYKITSNLFPDA